MPPVSAAQKRLMEAAAHTKGGYGGVPQSVGKEFVGDAGAPQAAGVVFVAPDGDVLVLLRAATETNYAGHWSFPGGKADGDETPEQAAEREVSEEIGDAPAGKLKLLDRRGTPNGMVFSTFARPVDAKFAPMLNDEHSGYAWVPLDRLPQPMHPSAANVLGPHIGVSADMSPEDWDGLRQGFAKWTREEEAEPAHQAANDEAQTDSVGRKHYDRVPISKANVCGYKGSEIPQWRDLGLQPDRIYQMLRDPTELANGASTFNGIQLLYKHVPVSADDHQPDEIVGTTGTAAEFEHPYLYNALSVWAQHAINGIDDKTRHELSSSYQWDADMTPGVFEGVKHDGVMRNLRGNHVAVIPKGRVGPDVALDEALPNHPPVKKESPVTKKTALLSRTALRLQAAVSALAMDEKPNLSPVLKGLTAKNFASRKPAIAKGLRLAFDDLGETVKGATPDDVIMKVLDMVEGQTKAEPPEADEAPAAQPTAATEPNSGAPEGGKLDMDKLKAWLASKGMSEDDMSELSGMTGDPAEDEDETEEEKKARELKAAAEKAAKDAEMKDMVSKPAMDQAIAAAVEGAEKRVLETAREINGAFNYVRPWVGELANDAAITGPSEVYRKALASLGVSNASTLHADALKAVLDAQPKPGARTHREPVVAMDAAAEKSLAERFPHAARISNLG